MENIFKVAKYEKTDEGFKHLGYDEYQITYLKGNKPHQIRVVVNGILTNRVINLISIFRQIYMFIKLLIAGNFHN